jgi:hypothetical protein
MAYALARIMTGADVEQLEGYHPGGVGTITARHYIEIGDSVKPSDLGYDDEDDPRWEALFLEGVLSEEEPPEDWNHNEESLNRYQVRKAVETLDATTAIGQAEQIQQPSKAAQQLAKKMQAKEKTKEKS